MPFQYLDIKKHEAREGELFIFDANVWLFWLSPPNAPKRYQRAPYVRFLNYLQGLDEDPEVLLPACVLSEVFNRLLNKGPYYDRFMKSPEAAAGIAAYPDEKDWYKKVYRRHDQYYKDRNSIYDSIHSFSPNISFVEDSFHKYSFDDLKTAVAELDFTDWQIWEAARDCNATIVTDDGDFVLENFPIVTNNSDLLARNPPPSSASQTSITS